MASVLSLEIVKPPPKWRTLLILGRVSNLPTIWSNCLAGWFLGGGGRKSGLFVAMAATSSLYIGGMFLNDAFDADFDRRHRKPRPITLGAIGAPEVWRWGAFWLALGTAGAFSTGMKTAVLSLGLVACILVYDATHKFISFGAVIMGTCRLLVYLVAASAGGGDVNGRVIWPAMALGCYVAGLSFVARKEMGTLRPPVWPVALLAAPLALSALLNDGGGEGARVALIALAAVWVVWSLAQTFLREFSRIGATVSWLLAGIALMDLVAVGQINVMAWAFPGFFLAALFLQRFIPAT